jgi:hypothetical protein
MRCVFFATLLTSASNKRSDPSREIKASRSFSSMEKMNEPALPGRDKAQACRARGARLDSPRSKTQTKNLS